MIKCYKRKRNTCYVCGKPMSSLCDATKKDGQPCDLPMCDEHRNRVGKDIDVCEYHKDPKYIEEAKQNRIKREEARKYFLEVYPKQEFKVVPGHWPDFKTVEEVDKWIHFQNIMMEELK